jgi:hypothetical protein
MVGATCLSGSQWSGRDSCVRFGIPGGTSTPKRIRVPVGPGGGGGLLHSGVTACHCVPLSPGL